MNTVTIKVVTSREKINRAFLHDWNIRGYVQISGNFRRGTYLVDVKEGKEGQVRIG